MKMWKCALAAAFCVLFGFTCAAASTVNTESDPQQVHSTNREPWFVSCGFNAVATILFLQTETNEKTLFAKRNIESLLTFPTVSFTTIIDHLVAAGLKCVPVYTSSLSDVVSLTPTGGSAVLQVLKSGRNHFAVLHHAEDDLFYYIDPPAVPSEVRSLNGNVTIPDPYQNLAIIVSNQALGLALPAAPKNFPTDKLSVGELPLPEKQKVFTLTEDHVEGPLETLAYATTVDSTSDIVTAQLSVVNSSMSSWKTGAVKGSCGCFKFHDIPKVLSPGDSVEWKFSFSNRELRSQGESSVIVALHCDSGKKRNVLVKVNTGSQGELVNSASIYPTRFSFGWQNYDWVKGRTFTLHLIVPTRAYSPPKVSFSNGLKLIQEAQQPVTIGAEQFIKSTISFSFIWGPGVYREIINVAMPSAGISAVTIPFDLSIR